MTKTAVRESEWLADLLRHGLRSPSFIPPKPIRELRAVTRYRKQLVSERTQSANRRQKVLESATSKLAAVACAILGVRGRAMLEALSGGEQAAAQMAADARGRLRQRLADLRQALEGRVSPPQRFLLRQILKPIDGVDPELLAVAQQLAVELQPYADASRLLQTIPGIGAPAPQRRRRCSAKSAGIGVGFPALSTWRRGRGGVRATTNVGASGCPPVRRAAIAGCAPFWARWSG